MTDENAQIDEASAEADLKAFEKFKKEGQHKRRHIFSPEQLANGEQETTVDFFSRILPTDEWILNFDPEKEFEEGYGLVVLPITQKKPGEDESSVVKVAMYAVPSIELIQSHDHGEQYIMDAIHDKLVTKMRNSATAIMNDRGTSLPYSVTDFIERQKRGGDAKVFNEIADIILAALKQRHAAFGMLNRTNLRQVLSSAAMASQFMPKMEEQGSFVTILESAIAQAKKLGHDPKVFQDMLLTRDKATLAEFDDEDDLDFSDLLGEDEGEEDGEEGEE